MFETNGDAARAPSGGRLAHLVAAAAIAVAGAGYLVGVHQPVSIHAPPARPLGAPAGARTDGSAGEDAALVQSLRYADVGRSTEWPNRGYRATIAGLSAASQDAPPAKDAASTALALASRAARRAYDGAPPIVPHAVPARDSASCLACHGEGFVAGSVRAPKIPHPPYANCLQCHVEAASSGLGAAPSPRNAFAGLRAPPEGARAWPGAPPTIPHATWMRGDCRACHGPAGPTGLASTHPWRENCLQCHASSWQLDRQVLLERLPSPAVGAVSTPAEGRRDVR